MREPPSIEVGAVLSDRYELVAPIAEGSMGDVYQAWDQAALRHVAIKVLRAEYLADDAMRRRFRREAAVLKALDHPAIVRLIDFEIQPSGLVFLVTELVQGGTLAARIREAPLDVSSAGAVLEPLADALHAAHAHGVLHGDLKPANVLWVEGQPRLIDFGASKILGIDRLTATGEVAGTPAYMAPEVLTGKGDVDQRIDVYGLGVVLYEALSGKHPFQDAHVGRLLLKIDAGDHLPLHRVCEVTASLAAVVHRAMHRDPSLRFDDVRALVRAWNGALAG
ncbi:MAG: serine/threonine-protein kinase [Polyangiales bacterium]